jgi:5-methylcytosine-specific restriction endonuclease McrA
MEINMIKNWRSRVYKKRDKSNVDREEWRLIRRTILERDKHECFRCRKHSINGKGLSVHHIIPRDEGGSNDYNNLITLCHDCHDLVEVENLRSLAEIVGSFDEENINEVEIKDIPREEIFERPAWHAWVYGGVRRLSNNH